MTGSGQRTGSPGRGVKAVSVSHTLSCCHTGNLKATMVSLLWRLTDTANDVSSVNLLSDKGCEAAGAGLSERNEK